jgi:hypothetical protein
MKSVRPALEELENMTNHIYYGYLKAKYEDYRKEYIRDYGYSTYMAVPPKFMPAPPIITLETQGRRKAEWWFTPNEWVSTSSSALAALAGQQGQNRFAQLTLAKEILTKPLSHILETLALGLSAILPYLVIEETQKTMTQQQRLYLEPHFNADTGTWRKQRYYRGISVPFKFGPETSASGKTTKWMPQAPSAELKKFLDTYNMKNLKAFDLHGVAKVAKTKDPIKGTLRKWWCPKCKIPIRASKVISLVCVCGEQIIYADKDREDWFSKNRHVFEDEHGNKYDYTSVPFNLKKDIDSADPEYINDWPEGKDRPWLYTQSSRTTTKCVKCNKHMYYNQHRSYDSHAHIPSQASGPKGPYYVEVYPQ